MASLSIPWVFSSREGSLPPFPRPDTIDDVHSVYELKVRANVRAFQETHWLAILARVPTTLIWLCSKRFIHLLSCSKQP